ncbi:putative E3 ubiquitin-protein ligase UNKL isoform X2 [Antedon mediterranea]|uniref:putative E3 ubiquitin-protein ligase UNKL isoform X2 n=1 Tax=Antedon mediterranea TaxID=105859 RepID=UPI003AF5E945
MPSEQQKSANSNLTTQPEKPFHYTYLKEFRTQQCQDFLQHKCPNHRPFTCFHWHFMNQRRRRPIRRRDGVFNYSPDVYCTKYDETTGICPDGEECAYLHRTTGDTERRYHLRYYKTGTCVHETDARGHCVKNGPHCAFAHGPHDLRQPVYDVRELMAQQDLQQLQQTSPSETLSTNGSAVNPTTTTLVDKDKTVQVDDPKWQDTNHVLAYYKTEPCKKPPRLCRQGYACPHYHNARDRRRSPKKLRCYRSTPCPNVKHGDEWGEISNCDQGDNCLYCHTRTEQQFHPEIYKSTKCNDMQQTGYCPRGPFCAFAHVDQEMSNAKNILEELNAPEVSMTSKLSLFQAPATTIQSMSSNMVVTTNGGSNAPITNNLGPIGKPRSNSQSSNYSSESGSYQKAPGSEREDTLSNLKKLLQNVDNDVNIDSQEKNRRKQNLLLSHNISPGSPFASSISNCNLPSPGTPSPSSMSVNATPFYPPSDTVGSVVGNALDDISIEDVTNIDRELIGDNDGSSVGSNSASLSHLGLLSSTAPVNIPMSSSMNHKTSISDSPGSPLKTLPPAFVPQHIQQQQQIEMAAKNAFFSQPNPLPSLHKLSMMDNIGTSCSPSRGPQSPLLTTMATTSLSNVEVQRLQEEVIILQKKLQSWEESWNQAKQACDAWKKEASDSNEKAKVADVEKLAIIQAKEEAKEEAKVLKLEIEGLSGGPHLHVLNRTSELNHLPLHQLKKLQLQLKSDLEKLEKVIHIREGSCCYGCQDKARNVVVTPCYHLVFCDLCAPNKSTCSICHGHVAQRLTIPNL